MDVYFSADHQVKITLHEMRDRLDHLLSKELLTDLEKITSENRSLQAQFFENRYFCQWHLEFLERLLSICIFQ